MKLSLVDSDILVFVPYSVGKDAKSSAPLRAKISQDDIIRANNVGFVGLVSNY